MDSGVNSAINNFANSIGVSVRDVSNRLKVIEMRLSFGKNSFFLQIIINPWAFKSVPPVVEIANINSKFRKGSFFKIEELGSTEGRYKIIFDEEVKSLWKNHFDLRMLWDEAISPAVEEIKSQITYRNLNIKPGAWSLFFPGGVKKHLDRLKSKSQTEGWNLLDEQASDLYRDNLIAKQKAAEVQLKAKIENFKLEIEKSESLEELDEIIANQDSDFVENLNKEINERIDKKRESFEEIDEPINFDNPNYTSDPNVGNTKKRKTRLRRY